MSRSCPSSARSLLGSAISIAIIGVVGFAAPALPAAQLPVAGTPGHADFVATVEARCPTFSWSILPGTERWRLAVYRVPGAAEETPRAGALVLSETLAGGFHSWTPSVERCLTRGETYAWSIGAQGRKGRIRWSEPRVFQVAERAPVALEEALAVVSRHLESEPKAVASRPERTPAVGREAAASPSRPGATAGISPSSPLGNPVLDLAGDLNLADFRPVLRFEHSAGPETWDLTATELGFFVVNDTTGATVVSIFDTAPAGALEIRDTGVTIAGDLSCSSCISGTDVAVDSLGAADLGARAVGRDEISTIRHVRVECNGGCSDSNLADICGALGLGSLQPIAVSCSQAQDFSTTVSCGGNNECSILGFNPEASKLRPETLLSQICVDTTGSDAVVFCLETGL